MAGRLARAAPTVMRAGPREATGMRRLRVAGRPVTVVLLIELRGAVAPQERTLLLEAFVARALAAMDVARGGLTSHLRAAMEALDATLREEAAGRGSPLVAGASMLALARDELLLAQAGPAVAYLTSDTSPTRRLPARGPWLRRDALATTTVDGPPPLGGGPGSIAGPTIEWSQLPLATGTRVLLTATAAAGALPREVTQALFRTPLPRVAAALDAALPDDAPAILLAPPDPPAPSTPGEAAGAGQDAEASGHPAAGHPAADSPPPGRPLLDGASAKWRRAEVWWARARERAGMHARRVGRSTARGAAKVLLGLFPARMAADRGGADWMRLAATAVIGIPVAALLLTALLVVRERSDAPPASAPAGSGVPVDAGELGAASDAAPDTEAPSGDIADRAAGIARLTELRLEAALSGEAGEERDVVAVGEARYVLNRQRGLVEWIGAGEARTAWRQGATVDGVVAGAPLDLFWLAAPAGGTGGRATVLDAAGHLWPLERDGAAVLPPLEDATWRVVTRAAGYDGRLYLLDRGGRIHRYTPLEGSGGASVVDLIFTGPPESWLQAEIDLSSARDMAIDGRILVLMEDGTLMALQGGGRTGFAVSGMPERMVNPRDLYASPGSDHILVADHGAGEVIVLGADGAFRARLRLPPQPRAPAGSGPALGRLPELHAVWWDEADSRLWLVSGNALYQAAYSGSPALRR